MNFNKSTIIALLVIGIIALAIPVTFKLVQQQQQVKSRAQEAKPADAIVKVGSEYLYKADLDKEFADNPSSVDDNGIRNQVIQKMIDDSKILQIAAAENLLTLDSTIFNSPTKDYLKRTEAVKKAKIALQAKVELKGSFVSIWFDNQRETPPSQSEKDLARTKITDLHSIPSFSVSLDIST